MMRLGSAIAILLSVEFLLVQRTTASFLTPHHFARINQYAPKESRVRHLTKAQTKPQTDTVLAKLSLGRIKGRFLTTDRGTKAAVFFGIPYGESTEGLQRFSDPIPKQPWKHTLDCLEYKTMCFSNISAYYEMPDHPSEDCLNMNIFAPADALSGDKRYPVIYYIHGGGWEFDFPAMFDTQVLIDNFVSHGLIFVTFGYRLGALGFWSTGTADAPGNYALKDMILGLKFVRNEIAHIGGDADQITLMGHSSGSMAVDILTVSPMSKGLFRQAIMLSGNMQADDRGASMDVTMYRQLAEIVGCAPDNMWDEQRFSEIVDCMRKVSPKEMTITFSQTLDHPSITPRVDGPGGVIPRPLAQLMKTRSPIATLLGTTAAEMSVPAGATESDFVAACTSIGATAAGEAVQQRLVTEALVRSYGASGNLGRNPILALNNNVTWSDRLSQLVSDQGFYVPCYQEARSFVEAGATVYLYSFDYVKMEPIRMEPHHAFDLTYVTGIHPFSFSAVDTWIRDNFATLFAQFAIHGNPTYRLVNGTSWKTFNLSTLDYLSVDVGFSLKQSYHKQAVKFWTQLVPERIGYSKPSVHRKLFSLSTRSEPRNHHAVTLYIIVATVCGAGLIAFAWVSAAIFAKRRAQQRRQEDLRTNSLETERTPLLQADTGHKYNAITLAYYNAR